MVFWYRVATGHRGNCHGLENKNQQLTDQTATIIPTVVQKPGDGTKTDLPVWLVVPCVVKSHVRRDFSQLCIHPVLPRQQDAEGFGRAAVTQFCCQALDNGPEKTTPPGWLPIAAEELRLLNSSVL